MKRRSVLCQEDFGMDTLDVDELTGTVLRQLILGLSRAKWVLVG